MPTNWPSLKCINSGKPSCFAAMATWWGFRQCCAIWRLDPKMAAKRLSSLQRVACLYLARPVACRADHPMEFSVTWRWKIGPALERDVRLLKPSEQTPLSVAPRELALEAASPGVLISSRFRDPVAPLCCAPWVDQGCLYGSGVTGRASYRQQRHLKRVSLGAGGKSPVIVFFRMRIEAAAQACASIESFS